MLRISKVVATLAMFVVFSFAIAPDVKAEHIFFDTDVNGTRLDSTSSVSILNLGPAVFNPTITSPTGTFVFTFRVYDPNPSPTAPVDTMNVMFTPDPTATPPNTLPPPTSQAFLYNGNGTATNPVIFSFTQQYLTPGRFDGEMRVFFTTEPNQVFVFPFILIATPIPEPTTLVLLGSGLAGVAARMRRRSNGRKN